MEKIHVSNSKLKQDKGNGIDRDYFSPAPSTVSPASLL
jgi:hypothetical protein